MQLSWSELAVLMESRRHVSPKWLVEPGPTAAQLHGMLTMAATAPDHGRLTAWRFVIVPVEKRHLLAEAFSFALVERDPDASPDQMNSAREKAFRAPLLMLAIARLGRTQPDIPALERMVSMGCAVQNILLAAHALGFGTGLTSGRAMESPYLSSLFALAGGEFPVCFINIGTIGYCKVASPLRPDPADFTTSL
ncbi:nitroreductase [Sphaerotilus sp.]|uniref:nitroreductase family protein n=1 Tax=Sphaerotilus sp. TaxID=2093942 RepID=UPI00286DB91D|nr:nitroreductase [Sphaerotilus sp.]